MSAIKDSAYNEADRLKILKRIVSDDIRKKIEKKQSVESVIAAIIGLSYNDDKLHEIMEKLKNLSNHQFRSVAEYYCEFLRLIDSANLCVGKKSDRITERETMEILKKGLGPWTLS